MKRLLHLLILLLSIFINVVQVNAQDSDDKAVLKGLISGRVVDGNGQPILNATVYTRVLSTVINGAPITATTDEQGRFQLEGLTSGNYAISALVPGYVMDSNPGNKNIYYRAGDNDAEITMIKGGVITGTVTGINNEPIIGLPISYVFLNDLDGKQITEKTFFSQPTYTDDRGVYRIYGLRPGEYLIRAGGSSQYSFIATAFDENQSIYYPGTSRPQAKTITVHSGDEIGNIDIRYRSANGFQITGNVVNHENKAQENGYLAVYLIDSNSKLIIDQSDVQLIDNKQEFKIIGAGTGNYDLYAEGYNSTTKEQFVSATKHIQVKNGDLTNIVLSLNRRPTIEGQIVRKKLDEQQLKQLNKTNSKMAYAEILINAQNSTPAKDYDPSITDLVKNIVPDTKGNFIIDKIHNGLYFLSLYMANKNWYLDAITRGDEKTAPQNIENLNNGIAVKEGNSIKNLNVKIAEGAGRVEGDINKENTKNIPALVVHLVPVDKNLADNLLRYYQVDVDISGHFQLENIAPGKYWAIAIPKEISTKKNDNSTINDSQMVWDDQKRTALRKAAETTNNEIEINLFQSVDKIKLAISNIKKEGIAKPHKIAKQ